MTEEINKAAEIIKSGGVILYPTDTVWGLGCDATNPEAIKKVYQIKNREESKSLIILLENQDHLNKYLKDVPQVAWELIEHAEKPLTIIYPDAKNLPASIIAPDGTIAIRIVRDEFCRQLIRNTGRPLVSTSANISGEPTPANFSQISAEILSRVDYTVNLRQNEKDNPAPSSIIQLKMNGEIKIIRK